MNKTDVIIIGSGLGGLLCGYILGREGFSVLILEQHSRPGGNLQTFTRHGNEFETGVHYIGALGPGQTLARYWKYFGLMDALKFSRLDPDGFDRIAFGDEEFALTQGFENFSGRLEERFPGDAMAINKYVETIREVAAASPLYNLELPGENTEDRYSSLGFREFLHKHTSIQHPASCPAKAGSPLRSDIPLSSVLSGNGFLYAGDDATPLRSAALIQHSFISGAYRIIGGSGEIIRALSKSITGQGGTMLTGKKVTTIGKDGEGFTVSTAAGETYRSRLLISGIHPAAALAMMPESLVRPAFRNRINALPNTVSSFALYLGLRKGAFRYPNHNYHYHASHDTWSETAATGSQWPRMYLLTAGAREVDQEFAETLTILTYMRMEEVKRWSGTSVSRRGTDYPQFKQERAQKLLRLVSEKFPSLPAAIEHMEISTPLTYRDYTGTPDGSLYGIRKDFRTHPASVVFPKSKIPGFFFTGQNTNIHGVLGVTIGAVATCGEILGLDHLLKKIRND